MQIEFACVLCGKHQPVDPFSPLCPDCGEPMLIHDPKGPRNIDESRLPPLERYRDFLPLNTVRTALQLGEGRSPLQRLDRLIADLDLPEIYAKNESLNPTGSFKDRGTVVAVHIAADLGIRRIGTVSTGNMAVSTAAYGARAGIKTIVLVKPDTPPEKLLSAGVHGAGLIQVAGDYGRLFKESLEIGRRHGISFMNSTDAFRVEGYKIVGMEIFEQMGRSVPEWIFVPVSSGGHLIGLIKSFRELKDEGLIDRLPRFVGVQARGCNPLAESFRSGAETFAPIEKPRSVAQSIINPAPPGGKIALKWIRELDGKILDASDEEILDAQRMLAEREGLFCLPASAVTLAGMLQLHRGNTFSPDDRVVLVITGSGAKNVNVLDPGKMRIRNADLGELDGVVQSLL